MRTETKRLPRALRTINESVGLEYIHYTHEEVGSCPVACAKLPAFENPFDTIPKLPLQWNFAREELDMDKPEDREEYNRIMEYLSAGYGAILVYRERKFVTKVRQCAGGKKRKLTQRIFIEYYAPYRVIPSNDNNT